MKNEMLALILAGGQGTRLGKLTQSMQNQLCNLVGATVSLTLLSQTVPTQASTMLELLHSINHLLSTIILEMVQVGV